MIKIQNVSKAFKHNAEKTEILQDLSLTIEQGQWCTVIGPSGTGKSTLLNCISGLLKPDQGEIFFGDTNIYKLSEKNRSHYRRKNVGFIFQDFKLLPYYSVLHNVTLPLIYDEPKDKLYARAKELLLKVGIKENLFQRLPEGLSGGEKQRVAIARALIGNPKVIIGDEPTGNLDIDNRDNILEILSDFNRDGQTIIIVTHDVEVAQKGDVIYRLYNGKLEAEGVPL